MVYSQFRPPLSPWPSFHAVSNPKRLWPSCKTDHWDERRQLLYRIHFSSHMSKCDRVMDNFCSTKEAQSSLRNGDFVNSNSVHLDLIWSLYPGTYMELLSFHFVPIYLFIYLLVGDSFQTYFTYSIKFSESGTRISYN